MARTKKTPTNYSSLLITILVLIGLIFLINKTMRDMQNTFRTDETIATTNAQKSSDINFASDPEQLVAQQVERMLNYDQATFLTMIKNIEDNALYSRNKAAVYFYMAFAYEQKNETEKATQIYERLRKEFRNKNIALLMIDTKRNLGPYKTYSVSIIEESLLRQAILNKDYTLLAELGSSKAKFGVSQKEGLYYSDLVVSTGNITTSGQRYLRFIDAIYAAKAFLSNPDPTTLAMSEEAEHNLPVVKPKLDKLIGKNSIDIDLISTRRTAGVYYYNFDVTDEILRIEIKDTLENFSVAEIK